MSYTIKANKELTAQNLSGIIGHSFETEKEARAFLADKAAELTRWDYVEHSNFTQAQIDAEVENVKLVAEEAGYFGFDDFTLYVDVEEAE